jgi:hypothetical protein
MSTANVNLIVGIGFGMLLESVACAAWFFALTVAPVTVSKLAFNSREAVAESHAPSAAIPAASEAPANGAVPSQVCAAPGHTPVAASSDAPAFALLSKGAPKTETMFIERVVSAEVAQLAAEVSAGRLRGTVEEVRKFFRCSQAKAIQYRRQWLDITYEQSGSPRI